MLEKLDRFCLTVIIRLVLLMWKCLGLFLRKNNLLRCWGWLSLLNWVLLLKLPPRKLEPWFILWSLILLRLLCISINLPYAYFYKSTIRPCMEYFCHVWAGAPRCYLELLDKLQKRICRTAGPWLGTSLEPLAHRRNVAILSLFYRYCFGRCSSELAQLAPLPFSRGRSTRYSNRLHDFSAFIRGRYKDVYVNSFFPRTARFWNSLPIESMPLTYDLNALMSRIKRHLLTVDSI